MVRTTLTSNAYTHGCGTAPGEISRTFYFVMNRCTNHIRSLAVGSHSSTRSHKRPCICAERSFAEGFFFRLPPDATYIFALHVQSAKIRSNFLAQKSAQHRIICACSSTRDFFGSFETALPIEWFTPRSSALTFGDRGT